MMQGMAGLATAQVKAGQRLDRVEKTLAKLVEIETRNSEMFSLLLAQKQGPNSVVQPGDFQTEPEIGVSVSKQKVGTRKVVNVRSPEGGVKSYSIGKDDSKDVFERPSDAFLNTPIVIRNEQGEFLGVPGRLALSGFIEALVRQAEENGTALSGWKRIDEAWVFAMEVTGGDSYELFFVSTTTPRGNLVVFLNRLDVNKKETTSLFLQEFFRKIKDNI
jgi:hypothetical protein